MKRAKKGDKKCVPDSPRLPFRFCVMAAALLLLSCSMPFFETAQDPLGWSGGGGIGFSAGRSYVELTDVTSDCRYFGPTIGGWASCGISEHFSTSLQAYLPVYTYGDQSEFEVTPSASLACKYAFDRADALKLSVGAAYLGGALIYPLVELTYLHDFGRRFTGSIGVGTNGVTPCLVIHFPSSGSEQFHFAVRGAWFPLQPGRNYSATIGLGVSSAQNQ